MYKERAKEWLESHSAAKNGRPTRAKKVFKDC